MMLNSRIFMLLTILANVLLMAGTAPAKSPTLLPSDDKVTALPYASSNYKFQTVVTFGDVPNGFEQPEFDDSNWIAGCAPFGNGGCSTTACTPWDSFTVLLIRKTFDLPSESIIAAELGIYINNDIRVWINGVDVTGYVSTSGCPSKDKIIKGFDPTILHSTNNTIAVLAFNYGSANGADLEVRVTKAPPHPDLKMIAGTLAAPSIAYNGTTVLISFDVQNIGDATASGTWHDDIYISADPAGSNPVFLKSFSHGGPLAPGSKYTVSTSVTIPSGLSGAYYPVIVADSTNTLNEFSGENNNTFVSPNVTTIGLLPQPDLIVQAFNPPAVVFDNTSALVSWTEFNQGTAAAGGSWLDRIYLSPDNIFGNGNDILLKTVSVAASLDTQGSTVHNETVSIPDAVNGAFYFIIVTDAQNQIDELPPSGESNNTSIAPISTQVIQLDFPDLAVTQVSPPAGKFAGESAQVEWTIQNNSIIETANGQWIDRVYLSTDDHLDVDDKLVAEVSNNMPVAPGHSYSGLASLSLPRTAGTYWLIVQTDVTNNVEEGSGGKTNNILATPLTVLAATYTAEVHTGFVEGLSPTDVNSLSIPLAGHAINLLSNQPEPNVPVTVRVWLKNSRRVFGPFMTDAQGNFSTSFTPLPNEAGHYIIFADHPAVFEDLESPQGSFDLIGLRFVPAKVIDVVGENASKTTEIKLQNLGDTAVLNISGVFNSTNGTVSGSADLPTMLGPLEEVTISYSLSAATAPSSQDKPIPANVDVSCDVLGVSTKASSLPIQLYITPATPNLIVKTGGFGSASNPVAILKGAQKVSSVIITNAGGAPAKDVTIFAPCIPNPDCQPNADCTTNSFDCPSGLLFNLITPVDVGDIPPGESRAIELSLNPSNAAIPGTTYDTTVNLLYNNSSVLTIPVDLKVTSDQKGAVTVRVEDEFTYYGKDGGNNVITYDTGMGPLVAGATLELFNAVDHGLVFSGETDASGNITIPQVVEGFYDVAVSAPKHASYQSTIEVTPGAETTVTAFVSVEVVTLNWDVAPTEVPDVYDINITAEFETFVPLPIITINPPLTKVDLQPGESMQTSVDVKNEGLVNALGTQFVLTSPPEYTFTALITDLGVLKPGQTVSVPVTIQRDPAVLQSAGCNTSFTSGVVYNVVCVEAIWHFTPVYWSIAKNCDNSPVSGGAPSGPPPQVKIEGPPPPPPQPPGPGGSPPPPPPPPPPQTIPFELPWPKVNQGQPNIVIQPPPCPPPPTQEDIEAGRCHPFNGGCVCDGTGQRSPQADGKTDPINLFSGELKITAEDLKIPGRGVDFVWTRTYRSKTGTATPQGNNWECAYGMHMNRQNESVVFYDGVGNADVYQPQSNNTWIKSGFFDQFTRNVDGSYTLTYANQARATFLPVDGSNTAGLLWQMIDRNGNTVTLQYDSAGKLTKILDSLQREINFAYNSDGFIESITDFAVRQVRYEYYQDGDDGGSFGDLKSVTLPAVSGTPNQNDFPFGKTTTYTYTKGFPTNIDRLNHNLLTITDAKGQTYLRNEYHPTTDPNDRLFDRVIKQTWGNRTDSIEIEYVPTAPTILNEQSVITVIQNDRVGNVTECDYDIKNRLIHKREYTGRAQVGQPTTLTSNRPANKLRASDPDVFVTKFYYNVDSLLTRIVYPNGNIRKNIYESDLNPAAPTQSRGNLREAHLEPGTHTPAGDQSEIVQKLEYDSAGGGCCGFNYVTKETDGNGNSTIHSYDSHGNRIKTVYAISSIEEQFEYNGFGQMTAHVLPDNGSGHKRRDEMVYYDSGPQAGYLQSSIVDSGGLNITSTFEYDVVGNCVRVVDPRGNDTLITFNQLNQPVQTLSPPSLNRVRYEKDYFYDENNNLARVDVANVDDQGQAQPNGALTANFEFDILNHVTRVTREVDATHSVITENEYDANRNITLVRSGVATNGSQTANVVRTLYDEREMVFQVIRGEGNPAQSTTQIDYDANGNRVAIREGLEGSPRVTLSVFDAFDRVVATTDPMGNVETVHFDASANRTSIRVDGELNDMPGSAGNVKLSQVSYTYDELNRVVKGDRDFFDLASGAAIGDGKATTTTVYSPSSQVLQSTDDNGHATSIVYDGANRPSLITDAKGNITTYNYDENGNVTALAETELPELGGAPQTFVTTNQYDRMNRILATTDNVGNTTSLFYNSLGDITTTVDARGNTVTNQFDGLRRLLQSTRLLTSTGDGSGSVIGQIVTKQEWDDNSRLAAQIDDNGNRTSYLYDVLNRQFATTFADGSQQTVAYDVHSNAAFTTDANQSLVTCFYDLDNRLTGKTVSRGPGVGGTTSESFSYDGLGEIASASNDASTVIRAHDSLGHVTTDLQNGKSVGASFDALGNMLTLKYSGGRIVNTTYDELNREKIISDAQGLITMYDYAGPGRVARRTNGNLTFSDYFYDAARRVSRITHSKVVGGAFDDREYTWDASYNKTSQHEMVSDVRNDYVYDSVSRLAHSTKTTAGAISEEIQYNLDGLGNRTSVVGGLGAGAYSCNGGYSPTACQLNQYTTTPFGSRGYDANGNVSNAGQPTGGPLSFVYDYKNELVSVNDGVGGAIAKYSFDALGRRISRQVFAPTPMTATYIYSGWSEIEVINSNGVDSGTYVLGRSLDEAIQFQTSSATSYFYADDQMSVRRVLNGAAQDLLTIDFADFGKPSFSTPASSLIDSVPSFTGRRFDKETGNIYYRTRMLDPLVGAFMSRDSIGIWGDPSEVGNGYSYIHNGPLSGVDPDGRTPLAVITGLAGAAYGAASSLYNGDGCGRAASWKDIGKNALRYGFKGAMLGLPIGGWGASLATNIGKGLAARMLASGLISWAGNFVEQRVEIAAGTQEDFHYIESLVSFGGGAVGGGVEFAVERWAARKVANALPAFIDHLDEMERARIQAASLDWSVISKTGETRAEHVIAQHGAMNLQKEVQGVFYSNPVGSINEAWSIAQRQRIQPIATGGVDIYLIPRANSGYAGGFSGKLRNLDDVTIITKRGTSSIITGFPGNGLPLPKQ
ncbi:MAG: hypothetical protein HY286_13565 [Planctomycetes bacterium]|nr:hypothetical protein [Planctomycetota bacterium]